jgi:hypothetical protein
LGVVYGGEGGSSAAKKVARSGQESTDIVYGGALRVLAQSSVASFLPNVQFEVLALGASPRFLKFFVFLQLHLPSQYLLLLCCILHRLVVSCLAALCCRDHIHSLETSPALLHARCRSNAGPKRLEPATDRAAVSRASSQVPRSTSSGLIRLEMQLQVLPRLVAIPTPAIRRYLPL